jgi:hypothetical protein
MTLFKNWNRDAFPAPSLIQTMDLSSVNQTSAEYVKQKKLTDLPKGSGFILRDVNIPYLPSYCGPVFLNSAFENRIADFDFLKNKINCSVFIVSYYSFPWASPDTNLFISSLQQDYSYWSKTIFESNFSSTENLNKLVGENYKNQISSYSYYYKNLETLVFVFFDDVENDLVLKSPINNKDKGSTYLTSYPFLNIFYRKYGFSLATAYGRFKTSIIPKIKPTPALEVTRFDRRDSTKPRMNGVFNTLDPEEIYLIPALKTNVNKLQYVFSVLEFLSQATDGNKRPLYWFDKNCIDFFDITPTLNKFSPTDENLEFINYISECFVEKNKLKFYQNGKAEGAPIRFDQYYQNNGRSGKIFGTRYSLNYTPPFFLREKFNE